MKRNESLRKKKEFRYTYRVGKSAGNHLLTLVYAKSRVREPRVGFSVSKKIGNSVTRNRAKRRMREAITPLMPEIRNNTNLIFIARDSIVDAPFLEIRAAMQRTLTRADLLKKGEGNPGFPGS